MIHQIYSCDICATKFPKDEEVQNDLTVDYKGNLMFLPHVCDDCMLAVMKSLIEISKNPRGIPGFTHTKLQSCVDAMGEKAARNLGIPA